MSNTHCPSCKKPGTKGKGYVNDDVMFCNNDDCRQWAYWHQEMVEVYVEADPENGQMISEYLYVPKDSKRAQIHELEQEIETLDAMMEEVQDSGWQWCSMDDERSEYIHVLRDLKRPVQERIDERRESIKHWEDWSQTSRSSDSRRAANRRVKRFTEELEAIKATMTAAEKIHDLSLQIPQTDLILEEINHA